MVNTDLNLEGAETSCIDSCLEAAQACERCIEKGRGEEMTGCIRACRNGAALTTLCARFIARQSVHVPEVAAACADVCEICADMCELYEGEHIEACTEICTQCADTCHELA